MKTFIEVMEVMRYPTAGDYFLENGVMRIQVFKQANEDYEFLIGLHEMIEEYLTRKRGITEQSITDFDLEYERNRKQDDMTSEPGDSKNAPYYREHRFAMIMEQLMAHELGVDWNDYDKNIKVYGEFNIE